jgi:fused signal recognition particle receptor
VNDTIGILAGLVLLIAAAGGIVWWTRQSQTSQGLFGGQSGRAEQPEDRAPTLFDRIGDALARTRASLSNVLSRDKMDDAAWEALEEALIRADMGPRTASALVQGGRDAKVPIERLRGWLAEEVVRRTSRFNFALAAQQNGPTVILVVGVNGAGKTTTIGKLASRYKLAGKSVMLGAADTFRAGAIDQLRVWGERAGVPVIAHQEGADPAAVCHDTVKSALAKGIDIVILDTAGRLQAHAALMDELAKVRRVVNKLLPGAPHEVLLVLDGTMGQNALAQARVFKEVTAVTGIVLTKLDGTAKGGVVVAIAEELNLPVKLVGCGEKLDDLRDFDPASFARGLFGPD